MSDQHYTPSKSKQDDNGIAPRSSTRKSTASKSSSSKNPSSSGKKDKKPGVNLTPVESLLFFNIVRFNNDPANVDWSEVAKHSNLKNAGSARVRFRQIQKKYGLETAPVGRQLKRKTRAVFAADEDDDEDLDADEDDDDSEELPSKKRLVNRRMASQRPTSRNESAVKEGSSTEGTGFIAPFTDMSIAVPVVPAQQGQGEQQIQGQKVSAIKQEFPARQMQVNNGCPAPLNGSAPPPPQQQHQQQQRGPPQPSYTFDASAAPYNMFDSRRAGTGMSQTLYGYPHTSSRTNPQPSHGMTPQQVAHLQNLHQRAYNAQWGAHSIPYDPNTPQSQTQNRVMQPDDGLYGLSARANYHMQNPQGYFGSQGQAGSQTINQAVTQAATQASVQAPVQAPVQNPTQEPAQAPATSMGNKSFASSLGVDSNTSAPGTPVEPLFGGLLEVDGSLARLFPHATAIAAAAAADRSKAISEKENKKEPAEKSGVKEQTVVKVKKEND